MLWCIRLNAVHPVNILLHQNFWQIAISKHFIFNLFYCIDMTYDRKSCFLSQLHMNLLFIITSNFNYYNRSMIHISARSRTNKCNFSFHLIIIINDTDSITIGSKFNWSFYARVGVLCLASTCQLWQNMINE